MAVSVLEASWCESPPVSVAAFYPTISLCPGRLLQAPSAHSSDIDGDGGGWCWSWYACSPHAALELPAPCPFKPYAPQDDEPDGPISGDGGVGMR